MNDPAMDEPVQGHRAWHAIRGLYAITPELDETPALVGAVAAAIGGGAALVQYRNKRGSAALRREQAAALLALCRSRGIPLIVNDDLALAAALGADGVHLGRDDDAVEAARTRLGDKALIGASCYDELDRARRAAAAGADYVAFGSFYPSPTKPGARRAAPEILQQARNTLKMPVVAIGGITPANGAALVAKGACALAVIDGLFHCHDIAAAARRYAALFSAPSGPP